MNNIRFVRSIFGRMYRLRTQYMFAGFTLLAATTCMVTGNVQAQTNTDPLKIGILSDQSGILSDLSGLGAVESAKLAIEDFGGEVLGRPIELLVGDHMNKTDVGLSTARSWYDDGVRAIFDIGVTNVAMGVQNLAREKNQIVVYTSSASSDLTGKHCSPNGIHWIYNSYSHSLGTLHSAINAGAKTWYFITVNYTYGKNVQRDATEVIEKAGGKVVGHTLHPFSMTDFSSELLQAQSSQADVVALATTTGHAVTIIKQADEFGLRASGQAIAALTLVINDVKAIGLAAAHDLFVSEAYYWDQNDETRKFAERYQQRMGGKMPNMVQAGMYGAIQHYLKAIAAAGTDDTEAVLAKMKEMPINDFMTQNGRIREDGRVLRDFFIFRVKKPSESKSEWDIYDQVSRLSPEEAFQPADKEACSLVN